MQISTSISTASNCFYKQMVAAGVVVMEMEWLRSQERRTGVRTVHGKCLWIYFFSPFSHAAKKKANMSDKKAVIKNADMSDEMQQDAVDCAMQAMEKYNIEKDIAAYVKKVRLAPQ